MIALLRHGWSLAYSQPGLLFYAVLVSLLSAQWLRVGGSVALTEEQLNALSANLLDIDSATILTALTVVVLSFSVYWLLAILGGNWSLAALIHGLGNAEKGVAASFTATSGAGVRHFWQVLVVGLITTGLLLLILAVGAGLALGALFTRQAGFTLLLVVWSPIVLAGGLALIVLTPLAQIHVVLTSCSVLTALKHAAGLVLRRPLRLLFVWLAADVLIGSLTSAFAVLPIALIAIPVVVNLVIQPSASPLALLWLLPMFALAGIIGGVGELLRRSLWVAQYGVSQQT